MPTIIRSGIDYPTSDGRPMAETDLHRDLMVDLIRTLQERYAASPNVYVSGNLLLFYREGDRRRHVSPDVFVIRGVAKRKRDNFLIWEEGKGPDVAIELTSKTTRREDVDKKFHLYESELLIPEYFLFDPYAEYLRPPLIGYRLRAGKYVPIKPIHGRSPSQVLGLHFERDGNQLRLYDPKAERWLPTLQERMAQAEDELIRLRKELAALRKNGARKH